MMGVGIPQSNYNPALDLVACAPDGRLAGYVFCTLENRQAEKGQILHGFTDPIAVHPDFRRRGLGLALVMAGLHRLKLSGAVIAGLSTTSQNIAMRRTATAAGFSVQSRDLWFSKSVPVTA